MLQRSHIILKSLKTAKGMRSAFRCDGGLGIPSGCTRCQITTLVHHILKFKYKIFNEKECSSWILRSCSQRAFSTSSLLYFKHHKVNDSSQKIPDSGTKKQDPVCNDKFVETEEVPVECDSKISNNAEEPVVMFKTELGVMRETVKEKKDLKQPVILPQRNITDCNESKPSEKLEVVKALKPEKPEVVSKNVLLPPARTFEDIQKKVVETEAKIKEVEIVKVKADDAKQEAFKLTDSLKSGDLASIKEVMTELVRANMVKLEKEKQPTILLEKAKNILRKSSATSLKSDDEDHSVKKLDVADDGSGGKKRQKLDINRSSLERNFITPMRAMRDFLLKSSDLDGLRKTKRRSPYENDPPIVVLWRKDVEAKAIELWGSKENLLKELMKRDLEKLKYQQNIFTAKRRLRDYRREQRKESEIKGEQNGLFGPSGKVVLTAIGINGSNFLFKLLAWFYTGSHSMFSEAIHSLADTINQLILAYGIHKSVQTPDSDHPYGYANMRYVSSLISGVGIFCVGSGLSIYHGVVGLTHPSPLESFYWAFFILGGSLASEGATLLVAFNSIRTGAKMAQMTLSEYVWRGHDPSVNVVLLEDLAAVIGVGIAGTCMGLSSLTGSHVPDAVGSLLVGGLLAGVASFIIYTNAAALVGRSIPQERLDKINAELESDIMIRAIHDVKGIDMGNNLVRYKAEMDFDGAELTRSYLDKQDLNQMLEEISKIATVDDLEQFMLKHGENIVDMMGGEIDRIEMKLRKKHPEIRHCDLEIL